MGASTINWWIIFNDKNFQAVYKIIRTTKFKCLLTYSFALEIDLCSMKHKLVYEQFLLLAKFLALVNKI